MQACVFTFNPRSGTGSQTVTGIVDRDGNPFLPKVVLFQSAYAAINTLVSGPIGINSFYDSRGVDTGTVRSSRANSDTFSPFNFKAVSTAFTKGDYSLLDVFTTNFGQNGFQRAAKITATRVGEFDLSYAQNDRTGDVVLCCALGGDDMDITFTNYVGGTYSTPSKPQGLLGLSAVELGSSGGAVGGAGGSDEAWGFAVRDGATGVADLLVDQQGQNYSALRTTAWTGALPGGTFGNLASVSAWGDTSVTYSAGAAGTTIPMVISGADIVCAGGTFDQPSSLGLQTIEMGIDARVIFFWSVGRAASLSTFDTSGQLSMGWATASSQVGFWTGERTVGNTPPIYGARILSNNSVIRCGTPNAASTTFDCVAALTGLSPTLGTATLNWTAVDSTPRQVIWFAIGTAIAPPPSIGMLLTQLPIGAAYPYQAVSSLVTGTGRSWVTPPPTRSRRGR